MYRELVKAGRISPIKEDEPSRRKASTAKAVVWGGERGKSGSMMPTGYA